MKKTYSIEVDCANCANLMEEAAQKTGRGLRRGELYDAEDDRGICGGRRPEGHHEGGAEGLQEGGAGLRDRTVKPRKGFPVGSL